MGAVLSIPLIPVQMAVSACGSFAGASITSALCGLAGIQPESSLAVRLIYAFLFVLNCLLSWVSLTDWAISKLDLLKYACNGDECTGFIAVHRIQLALGMLHISLAILFSAVIPESARNPRRTSIQNGWWRTKFFVWLIFTIIAFRIPAGFWKTWGNVIAPVFSAMFIFIGLVVLVDCAHSWAERCFRNIDEGDNPGLWAKILVGSTAGMYLLAMIMSGVMIAMFAVGSCSLNQAAITLNIIFAIITSVLSIHPVVQEYNSQSGLAQAAMVCLYNTYLVMSAVASEPDDKQCNPFVRSRGTRTATIVIGALFTFLAVAYTCVSLCSRKSIQLDDEDMQMQSTRTQALRQAVAEGSLPQSALEEAAWEVAEKTDDYNFPGFHLLFFLATQYTATLLTMNVETAPQDNFVPIGRTYYAVWMKIISSWLLYALYSWSLVAPAIFPDKF